MLLCIKIGLDYFILLIEFCGGHKLFWIKEKKMLNHVGSERIETERLILRRFEYGDNESMRRNWVSDPVSQGLYLEPAYCTQVEVKELLDKYINSYEQKDYYRWAVISKENLECIGQIAIFLVDSKNHFCEVEYCIGEDYRNKGFATEVTREVIKFGFEKVNFHKVQISHKSNNNASKKVIEKCGFVFEGSLRDYFYEDGKYVDRVFYSIIKDEWK